MLVLSRKRGERIQIGDCVTMTVLSISGTRVKLGFESPREVPIHRDEVKQEIILNGPNAEGGKEGDGDSEADGETT